MLLRHFKPRTTSFWYLLSFYQNKNRSFFKAIGISRRRDGVEQRHGRFRQAQMTGQHPNDTGFPKRYSALRGSRTNKKGVIVA
ncbi:hypothetical protein CEXT_670101 [Caerostris extrusa]|uniref:Uncharacterized protein n=1 Tax=Caerostris extrusa TaxID=172846 RepID=A0AAV4PCH1_CAEEX|nr:hypothetical protein CEXT_670101 [Caerostris extrusa]